MSSWLDSSGLVPNCSWLIVKSIDSSWLDTSQVTLLHLTWHAWNGDLKSLFSTWHSVLQCVAVCCSVLQCVEVCCSVLPCVAVLDLTHLSSQIKSSWEGVKSSQLSLDLMKWSRVSSRLDLTYYSWSHLTHYCQIKSCQLTSRIVTWSHYSWLDLTHSSSQVISSREGVNSSQLSLDSTLDKCQVESCSAHE